MSNVTYFLFPSMPDELVEISGLMIFFKFFAYFLLTRIAALSLTLIAILLPLGKPQKKSVLGRYLKVLTVL